jgi:hypothetical protein
MVEISFAVMKEELVFVPLVPPILLFNNATWVHQDSEMNSAFTYFCYLNKI